MNLWKSVVYILIGYFFVKGSIFLNKSNFYKHLNSRNVVDAVDSFIISLLGVGGFLYLKGGSYILKILKPILENIK